MAKGRNTKVSSKVCNHEGLDFIIVNILEDFPVLHLSSPPHSIPKWNKHDVHDVEAILEFGGAYLHDDVVFS